MHQKLKKMDWRRGNGSMIFGTGIMLVCLSFVLMFIQTFIIRQDARSTQLAADSIADGTAVFMANEGGDYDDAVEKAEEIQDLVEATTGVDTGDSLEIDEELLENENQVAVTVTSTNSYLDVSAYLSEALADSTYEITRSATTEFTGYGNDGFVNWMISVANDDTVGYSQNRRFMNPDVDCSSFVYYALINNGYTTEQLGTTPFTTYTMGTILTSNGFREIAYSEDALQPGDILWKETHTEVYIGDGKTVGAHSDYDGVSGDSSGREVSIANNIGVSWTKIYRAG